MEKEEIKVNETVSHPIYWETRSARVKCVRFHPSSDSPLLAAALYNGVIQIWNYQRGELVGRMVHNDQYAARCLDWNPTMPSLLVTGGDDQAIQLWNSETQRRIYTLKNAHLDYIRSVQFHPELSWLMLSASDDQTARLWDHVQRTCLFVLTGHNHYVMQAHFLPPSTGESTQAGLESHDDVRVVTASLDQTVKVWDMKHLLQQRDTAVQETISLDAYGAPRVKFVLEGHQRGVNWAASHHSNEIVASGGDDRQVKLWRLTENKAWEVDSLSGHTHNVTCCLFHPVHNEICLSASEDASIRVWNLDTENGNGKSLQIIRGDRLKDWGRFWCLDVADCADSNPLNPPRQLVAAGHDSGLILFEWPFHNEKDPGSRLEPETIWLESSSDSSIPERDTDCSDQNVAKLPDMVAMERRFRMLNVAFLLFLGSIIYVFGWIRGPLFAVATIGLSICLLFYCDYSEASSYTVVAGDDGEATPLKAANVEESIEIDEEEGMELRLGAGMMDPLLDPSKRPKSDIRGCCRRR